jgi:hypothetical protein
VKKSLEHGVAPTDTFMFILPWLAASNARSGERHRLDLLIDLSSYKCAAATAASSSHPIPTTAISHGALSSSSQGSWKPLSRRAARAPPVAKLDAEARRTGKNMRSARDQTTTTGPSRRMA